jgi:shikimate dehydrogenase
MSKTKMQFGLLGKNINYSFSRGYFAEKFAHENLENCSYENFDITDIVNFGDIIAANPALKGMNVTIPYKEVVIPYLDKLSKKALQIGAVNTIKISKKGKLKGYNTDCYGFKKALEPLLKSHHKKALILGTGGSSKAVAFALAALDIDFKFVSRSPKENAFAYHEIDASVFNTYQIVINCTPIGTSPNVAAAPDITYSLFTPNHIAFDLIYNPAETAFLRQAKNFGASTKNGLEMLVFQAEKAWEIWNK